LENRPRRGVSEFNPSRGPLAYRVSRVSRVSRVVCVPAPYGIFDRLPFIFESTYDLDIYLERVSRLTIRCLTSTQATSSKAAKAIRVCFRGDTLSSKHLASHHKCRDKRRNMPVRHPASCGERDFHTCRSRPGATSPTKEHARASSSDGELWGKRFSYLSLASWGNFSLGRKRPRLVAVLAPVSPAKSIFAADRNDGGHSQRPRPSQVHERYH